MRRVAVIAMIGSLFAAAGLLGLVGPAEGASIPTAYVVNSLDGTLTPIDTSTDAPGSPIPETGQNESIAIAITPNGQTAYVANAPTTYGAGTVTPINLATGTAGTPITVGVYPDAVTVSPDGATVYVADYGGGVTPISTATDTAGPSFSAGGSGGPDAVVISPDGQTLYVAESGGTVTPIDTATDTVGPAIDVGSNIDAEAITPNGETIFVANSATNTVTPITTATQRVGQPVPVGTRPIAIAVTPDGDTAYVVNNGPAPTFDSNQYPSNVTPINVATDTAGPAIGVGEEPDAIAITPNGKTAYVVNNSDDTVTPINTATNTAGAAISVGNFPIAIAITPAPVLTKLSALKVSPRDISLAGRSHGGRCAKPGAANAGDKACRLSVRAQISYTTNVTTTITFTIKRISIGRLVGGQCVPSTAQTQADGPCVLRTSLPGEITETAATGHDAFVFDGQIGGQQLGRGNYVLTATPSGGAPRRARFRITDKR